MMLIPLMCVKWNFGRTFATQSHNSNITVKQKIKVLKLNNYHYSSLF